MHQPGRMHSTPLGQWSSTDVFMSTPHSAHENSESKQDSGYCSHTPSSSESYTADRKCQNCDKYLNLSHAQSTPSCCKRHSFYETPNIGHLQSISEANVSHTQKLLPRARPLDLYDEVMDTSLYPDDMEVEQINDFEGHPCALDIPEIGEENSIDFVENIELKNIGEKKNDGNIDTVLNNVESNKFFSPDLEYINCDLIGPKVTNETTPAKSRQSCKFQGVAKKVTTLSWVVRSFSLSGIERLDFFYQLGVKRNCPHIIGQILSFLSGKDLDSIVKVSKTWNEFVQKNRPAYDKWQDYLSKAERHMTSPRKSQGAGERHRAELTSPLRSILSNLNSNPSVSHNLSPRLVSPPVSPESARFRSFQRAAKNLKHGERLLPCPKCYFPSHDHGSPTVQCSRSGCRHRFCVWCRNEVIPSIKHDCPPLYTPHVRRSIHKILSVGSKSSKRILRRL